MKILLILLLLQLPVYAATKDGTILIKRGGRRRKALLDYKFVFMDKGSAFASDSKSIAQTNRAQVSDLSSLARLKESSKKAQKSQSINITPKPAVEDVYNESNWNDFALDESLNVDAKLLTH